MPVVGASLIFLVFASQPFNPTKSPATTNPPAAICFLCFLTHSNASLPFSFIFLPRSFKATITPFFSASFFNSLDAGSKATTGTTVLPLSFSGSTTGATGTIVVSSSFSSLVSSAAGTRIFLGISTLSNSLPSGPKITIKFLPSLSWLTTPFNGVAPVPSTNGTAVLSFSLGSTTGATGVTGVSSLAFSSASFFSASFLAFIEASKSPTI